MPCYHAQALTEHGVCNMHASLFAILLAHATCGGPPSMLSVSLVPISGCTHAVSPLRLHAIWLLLQVHNRLSWRCHAVHLHWYLGS